MDIARSVVRVLIMLAVLGASTPARAQGPPGADLDTIKAEVERLRADVDLLKSQLGQLLRLLRQRSAQGRAAAPGAPVQARVGDAPTLGRADAPVTLVEFSDYQCPFCQRFFATTFPTLKRDYIDTGKLRYVFRDFPLDQIHPHARKAAEAAHCAGEQGKYWEMHDRLFHNQQALSEPELGEHARTLGLDGASFDDCLRSGRAAARVSRGLADGGAAGVQGTPAFVVGKTRPGDTVEGTPVVGAQPVEVFQRLIEQLLAEK